MDLLDDPIGGARGSAPDRDAGGLAASFKPRSREARVPQFVEVKTARG